MASSAFTFTTGSGSRWIRCVIKITSKGSGIRVRHLGKFGSERLLAMKILITGNLGYVGPIVERHLRRVHPDANIIGYDSAFFALSTTGAQILPERSLNAQYFGDVREISDEMLRGVDAVVHLAAVSNDPMGNRFERVTEDINYRASVDLGRKASKAGVSHFVFASSCSVYGFAPGGGPQGDR